MKSSSFLNNIQKSIFFRLFLLILVVISVDVIIHLLLHIFLIQNQVLKQGYLLDSMIQITMLIFGLVIYKAFSKDSLLNLGFYRKDRKSIKKYLVIFFVAAPIGLLVSYLLVYFYDKATWYSIVSEDQMTLGQLSLQLLKTGILPGLSEETLYRGAMIGTFFRLSFTLKSKKAFWMMLAVISAVIFSFAHVNIYFSPFRISYNIYQLFTALILGFYEAYIFIKTRNIWSSIIVHASWNMISALLVQILILLF